MKIFKLSAIFFMTVLLFTSLYAQDALKKHVYSIGGSAQYSSLMQDGSVQNTAIISPRFTYFVADHTVIGALIGYNYYYDKETGGDHQTVSNTSYLSAGASFRYYFFVKKAVPFLEASFAYSVYFLKSNGSEHAYNIGLKGGLDIFLSSSVAVEPFISYNYIQYVFEIPGVFDLPALSVTQTNKNISAGIGMDYFIF